MLPGAAPEFARPSSVMFANASGWLSLLLSFQTVPGPPSGPHMPAIQSVLSALRCRPKAEVAVMKAITAAFVMRRPGADAEYSRQREMIAELVHALTLEEGRSLEPSMADAFARAETDSQRFRVIIDQVASLTDVSLVQWHKRLVR